MLEPRSSAVFRWRVAYFDQHNDITKERHEANYAARLRSGHATIVRDFFKGRPNKAMATSPEQGYSGVMIARVQEVTGTCQVLYMSGRLYTGKMTRAHKAIQLGLLKGLRVYRRHAWGPVHVVGDDIVVTRQHETRTPPRAADLKTPYWAARRKADALGVVSWRAVPRERNRAVHEIMRVVMSTQQDMEWSAREDLQDGASWAAVTAFAPADARYWRQVHDAEIQDRIAESTV
ncbi:hypothetical protein PHYPSEUDO_006446 [Phytophthora pseudosyringae]|uniref:RNase H type-1 domain-containing protein n=1 Tax=Phytophthora pseudosyringae TaxID=221518 RepID=A0A8T1VLW7_9STRA|nr:hypothetical protein PHYPSEUDO_006446 [Phytophthora pseudosyringae]